jgi:hypothetical protein
LPRVTSPFRDELETLLRENESLRSQLARPRVARPVRGFTLIGVDIAAAMLLRPWLNAGSDARFWGALAILAAITLAAGWAALGYKQRAT